MINVLGDALAAGIIAHLCRKDFPLGDAGKVQSFVDGAKTPLVRVRVKLSGCFHDNSNVAKVKQEVRLQAAVSSVHHQTSPKQ